MTDYPNDLDGLRWEKDDAKKAGYLIFDRPAHEHDQLQGRSHIAAIIRAMDDDPDVRVIVIRGANGLYSSGGDIAGFLKVERDGMHFLQPSLPRKPARSCHGFCEAKFMLPWSFSEEAAAEKYAPQLQHNMWVVAARAAVLSVITGGGKWVEIKTYADPLYQHLILTAERKFWRCVESGEPPSLFGIEPPKPRIEAVRIVDMSASNAWAEFAAIFSRPGQRIWNMSKLRASSRA